MICEGYSDCRARWEKGTGGALGRHPLARSATRQEATLLRYQPRYSGSIPNPSQHSMAQHGTAWHTSAPGSRGPPAGLCRGASAAPSPAAAPPWRAAAPPAPAPSAPAGSSGCGPGGPSCFPPGTGCPGTALHAREGGRQGRPCRGVKPKAGSQYTGGQARWHFSRRQPTASHPAFP